MEYRKKSHIQLSRCKINNRNILEQKAPVDKQNMQLNAIWDCVRLKINWLVSFLSNNPTEFVYFCYISDFPTLSFISLEESNFLYCILFDDFFNNLVLIFPSGVVLSVEAKTCYSRNIYSTLQDAIEPKYLHT